MTKGIVRLGGKIHEMIAGKIGIPIFSKNGINNNVIPGFETRIRWSFTWNLIRKYNFDENINKEMIKNYIFTIKKFILCFYRFDHPIYQFDGVWL